MKEESMAKPRCVICGTSGHVELTSHGEDIGAAAGGVIGYGVLTAKGASIGAMVGSVVPFAETASRSRPGSPVWSHNGHGGRSQGGRERR